MATDNLQRLVEDLGPTTGVKIHYDDTNRSTGKAEVTFTYEEDARQAVREFDGANAKGQPIRVRILPSNVRGRGGNPLDRAVPPVRSLLDRVEGGRSGSRSQNQDRDRSRSPGAKRAELRANAREDIDRYVPDDRDGSRARRRSPRRGGDRGDRGGDGRKRGNGGRADSRRDDGGQRSTNGRPRMTQEELDRDMDNYFNKPAGDSAEQTATVANPDDDIDMAE